MKSALTRLLSYFPTKIPVGKTQFDAWLDDIVAITGPIADSDSLKWVISNEIMRIKSGQDRIPKAVLVRTLRKFAANQLAAAVVTELKEKQEKAAKEAQLAAQAAKNQAEDTASTMASSSDGKEA